MADEEKEAVGAEGDPEAEDLPVEGEESEVKGARRALPFTG